MADDKKSSLPVDSGFVKNVPNHATKGKPAPNWKPSRPRIGRLAAVVAALELAVETLPIVVCRLISDYREPFGTLFLAAVSCSGRSI
jgi:hypothetical protein